MSELRTLPISKIAVMEGANPRSDFDGAALAELTASIKAHGIITPLTVRENGKGHVLVAGERRLRAAKAAGLKEVPVIVRADEDALPIALVENLHRADLNPVEEGHAYVRGIAAVVEANTSAGKTTTPKVGSLGTFAKLVNISPERVARRVALTKLPEGMQQAVIARTLTLAEAERWAEIAEDAPEIVAAVAEQGLSGEQPQRAFDSLITGLSPHYETCEACDGEGFSCEVPRPDEDASDEAWDAYESAPTTPCGECKQQGTVKVEATTETPSWFLASVGHHPANPPVMFGAEAMERLQPLLDELDPLLGQYAGADLGFDREDADAARAYGCLLEVKGYGSSYVTDRAWAIEAMEARLKARIAEAKKGASRSKSAAKATAEPGTPEAKKEAEEKAEARKEREAERKNQEATHTANLALYGDLHGKLGVKATHERVRALCLVAFDAHDWSLAARLPLGDATVQEVRRNKDGRWSKLNLLKQVSGRAALGYGGPDKDAAALRKALRDPIAKAKTADEAVTATVRAFALGRFLSSRSVSMSSNPGHPHTSGTAEFDKLVEKDTAKLIPAKLRKG